jgi:hypothetical protein
MPHSQDELLKPAVGTLAQAFVYFVVVAGGILCGLALGMIVGVFTGLIPIRC